MITLIPEQTTYTWIIPSRSLSYVYNNMLRIMLSEESAITQRSLWLDCAYLDDWIVGIFGLFEGPEDDVVDETLEQVQVDLLIPEPLTDRDIHYEAYLEIVWAQHI